MNLYYFQMRIHNQPTPIFLPGNRECTPAKQRPATGNHRTPEGKRREQMVQVNAGNSITTPYFRDV